MQRLDRPAQPKVSQLERLEIRGAEEVGSLDVAVDEGGFAGVKEAERGAELRTPARDEAGSAAPDKSVPTAPLKLIECTGMGAYQEKDVSVGGRHELPFLPLAVSASCRHPPSNHSRTMIGSAKFIASMLAPTNPTTLGCCLGQLVDLAHHILERAVPLPRSHGEVFADRLLR